MGLMNPSRKSLPGIIFIMMTSYIKPSLASHPSHTRDVPQGIVCARTFRCCRQRTDVPTPEVCWCQHRRLWYVMCCSCSRPVPSNDPVDFGCGTDGTCDITQACPPLTQLGCKLALCCASMILFRGSRMDLGADGLGQMQHFVENDGYNVFRLPVGWQYLTYNQMTGVLNETQFANYNMLVNACLSTGAYCEIDIHNYARYDGEVGIVPVTSALAKIRSSIRSSVKVAPAMRFLLSSGTTLPTTGKTKPMSFSECKLSDSGPFWSTDESQYERASRYSRKCVSAEGSQRNSTAVYRTSSPGPDPFRPQ